MIIAIQTTGVTLDLPADIKLNIEASSPFFSNAGSMSLPISLPLSPHNRRALNFPDRLDIYDSEEDAVRAIRDMDVIVTQGSWQQPATLSISGCSEYAAEATLYFNESNIWSKIADMTLPQVMAGLHYGAIPEPGADIATYRTNLFNALRDDFQNYPVFIDPRESEDTQGHMDYQGWESMLRLRADWLKERDFVMAPVHTEDGWLNKIYYPGGLAQTDEYKYITAFLRLDYVLHKIFEKAGYELTIDFSTFPQTSEYDSHFDDQWHAIVLLNNTMDALYPGCLYYSALVPEISCKEFLLAVRAQFGCAFAIQQDGSYKMTFSETTLSNSSGSAIPQFGDLQIAFNSKPDYSPVDDIEKSEPASIVYLKLPDTLRDDHYASGHDAWDSYPTIHTVSMEGVCQRTTTTTTDDEDSTKDKKCPLIFASADFAFIYHTEYDQQEQPHTEEETYPAIRKPYIELLGEQADPQDITGDISQYYFSSPGDLSLYELANRRYNTIIEKCDRLTIVRALSTYELANFDFSKPLIIKNRLCFPEKLQYELTNRNIQIVTMELLAPRK